MTTQILQPPGISKIASAIAKKLDYDPNRAMITGRQALTDYAINPEVLDAFDRSLEKLGISLYLTGDSVFQLCLRETHNGFITADATHHDYAIFFVLCLMEEVNAHDLYATFKGELNV
jgi:hypothetical protein